MIASTFPCTCMDLCVFLLVQNPGIPKHEILSSPGVIVKFKEVGGDTLNKTRHN